jgi:hypothetical protein
LVEKAARPKRRLDADDLTSDLSYKHALRARCDRAIALDAHGIIIGNQLPRLDHYSWTIGFAISVYLRRIPEDQKTSCPEHDEDCDGQ